MALKCKTMNFGDIIDVLSSRVICFAENIFIMNTIQVEETVSASNTIFWIAIHVNRVKCFKS